MIEKALLPRKLDLKGHSDWITAIETGHPQKDEDTQVLITASRDNIILIW